MASARPTMRKSCSWRRPRIEDQASGQRKFNDLYVCNAVDAFDSISRDCMNPIHQWIVAHSAAKHLLRRCPKCGNTQKVRKDQAQRAVACAKCGNELPA